MKMRLFAVLGATVLVGAMPEARASCDVGMFNVAKFEGYEQTGTGAPTIWVTEGYQFFAGVEMTATDSVTRVTVGVPGGTTQALSKTSSLMFSWGTNYPAKATLDAAFPSGTYTVIMSTKNDGVRVVNLSMPSDAYPPAAHISNWTALQNAEARGTITVQWDAIGGGSDDDLVRLAVYDAGMQEVYSTSGLTGTNVSALIPAFTLQPGQPYKVMFMLNRIVTTDTTSYPGARGHTSFQRNTSFSIMTGPATPLSPVAVDLGAGWRWLGWFGYFADPNSGWIYHIEHEWMYCTGSSTASIWFWTSDMGWLWSSEAQYPFLYRAGDGVWLWYLKDSVAPRWFYNLTSHQWEPH